MKSPTIETILRRALLASLGGVSACSSASTAPIMTATDGGAHDTGVRRDTGAVRDTGTTPDVDIISSASDSSVVPVGPPIIYNDSDGGAGPCSSVGTPPTGLLGCGGYSLPLVGDASACGLTTMNSYLGGDGGLCSLLCRTNAPYCYYEPDGGDAGGPHVGCTFPCAAGRRPSGLEETAATASSEVGAYFARAAWLEAASVDAFEVLARELEAHGAPASLVTRARRSAGDEVRHAQAMARVARRFGAEAPEAVIATKPTRWLEAVAVENAVEGCVEETFAALVAMHEAERSTDAGVKRAMKAIAADEARHAELAWDVAAWLDTKLTAEERARVEAARRDAVARLGARASATVSSALATTAGLPSGATARRMVAELRRTLWS